jgi:hypothetical protein
LKFFEYRLKDIAFSSFQLLAFISSGERSALPMGVAPKAITGCLQPFIDSNISFTQLFLFHPILNKFSLYLSFSFFSPDDLFIFP